MLFGSVGSISTKVQSPCSQLITQGSSWQQLLKQERFGSREHAGRALFLPLSSQLCLSQDLAQAKSIFEYRCGPILTIPGCDSGPQLVFTDLEVVFLPEEQLFPQFKQTKQIGQLGSYQKGNQILPLCFGNHEGLGLGCT